MKNIKQNEMINFYKLDTPSTKATGKKNIDGSFTVLKNSTMKNYGSKESVKLRNAFSQLVDEAVIKIDDSGKAIFLMDYIFSDEGKAASFLMHRGGNNGRAWKQQTNKKTTAMKKTMKPKRLQKKPINLQSRPKMTAMKKQQLKIKPQAVAAEEQAKEVEGTFIRFAGMSQGIKTR